VPQALADRRQMQAVIAELLANAATAANGRPHIQLSAEADEVNDAVLLTVRDDGPGMDQQVLVSVFTPFFSSQQAGRRRGLGLPRAKRYVENNGGRIWIRSQQTEGTTVYVQLPRVRG
jgi:signal transduction histidine kinase